MNDADTQPTPGQEDASLDSPDKSTHRSRILIVDDEDGVRSLLFDILSDSYDCEVASGGTEAISCITVTEYDAVLSDIKMPDVSGLEVLKFARKHRPDACVILVTATRDTHQAIEAMRLGAFDYILKPFDVEEVELSVQRGILYKRLEAENRRYQAKLESLVLERTVKLQEATERLEQRLLEVTLSHRAMLSVLATALEAREVADRGRTERVAAYAVRLGRQLGLSESRLEALEIGSLLHDLGMLFVPDRIVRKPEPLDEDEWETVREHPKKGAELLERIGFFDAVLPIVEQHHERWDGSGYPLGLAGDAIDLTARIFAVADYVEGTTTARRDAVAQPFDDVVAQLRANSGSFFDPTVVDAFFQVPREEWDAVKSRSGIQVVPVNRVTGPIVMPES